MKLYQFSQCRSCGAHGQRAGENLWRYGICDDCETYHPGEPELTLHQERLSEICSAHFVIFNEAQGRWDFANAAPKVSKADRSWKNV